MERHSYISNFRYTHSLTRSLTYIYGIVMILYANVIPSPWCVYSGDEGTDDDDNDDNDFGQFANIP